MDPEFVNLPPENLADEHLSCIIRVRKPHPGVEAKRQWLADRLREGHVFRKLQVKDPVFIEYAPLETAWVPVLGVGVCGHAARLSLGRLSAIFPKPMSAFGTACIRWLYRRKPFVRRGADPEAAAEKWCAFVAEYHDAFAAGIRHRGKLAGALALALGQCAAYMSVAYCTYRGFGLRGVPFWQVTGTQVLLYIGASCFPMPGASGASEGTFYLAFSPLFGDYLTTAMLIWRLASYYLTIVLGYIAVVAERVTLRRAET